MLYSIDNIDIDMLFVHRQHFENTREVKERFLVCYIPQTIQLQICSLFIDNIAIDMLQTCSFIIYNILENTWKVKERFLVCYFPQTIQLQTSFLFIDDIVIDMLLVHRQYALKFLGRSRRDFLYSIFHRQYSYRHALCSQTIQLQTCSLFIDNIAIDMIFVHRQYFENAREGQGEISYMLYFIVNIQGGPKKSL